MLFVLGQQKQTFIDLLLFNLVSVFNVLQPLPASEYHSYVFPGAVWGRESWKGVLVHTVPFTHPGHVPALLDLLRHQSAINLLLASCFSNHSHHIVINTAYSCIQLAVDCQHILSDSFAVI